MDARVHRLPTRDGVELCLERHAPGIASSQSLCLAHGFGQTRMAWQRSAALLAASGYEVISADARGHGDSGRNGPGQRYDFRQFVDDVSIVAAQAAHPRPVWVGASMGGLLGLMASTDADGPAFSALVLVDITPRWSDDGVARILDFMRGNPDGFASLDEAADAVVSYLPQRPRKSAERLRSLLREGADGRLRWHWDPRLLDELDVDGNGWSSQLEDATRRLDLPTLLISGGRSDLVGDEQVEHFLELAPHAMHVRLPTATHMVVGDENDAFTRAVLDFLPTVGSPAGQSHGASSLGGHRRDAPISGVPR